MIRNLLFWIALLSGLTLFLSACDADSQLGSDGEAVDGVLTDARRAMVEVTSICEGIWRVGNPTTSPVDFGWTHQTSTTAGNFDVDGGSTVYFRTGHVSGDRNRLRYTIDDKNGGQINSNNEQCTYSLTGVVYNVTDADLLKEEVSDGIPGMELVLVNVPGASSMTNASGVYRFEGLSFSKEYSVNWGTGGNTTSIKPYYTVQPPSVFPYTIQLAGYPNLEQVGDYTDALESAVRNVALLLDPVSLRTDFEGGKLERDDNDDHFWWQQLNRALGGEGGQNNAVVKRTTLLHLLNLIEFGGDGIDPFFAEPFTFGEGDDFRLRRAEGILKPPDNRNTSQSRFESALLTVWLNRVYDTRINTALLDGLLLGAENAYRVEFGTQTVSLQMTIDGAPISSTYSAATSSLSTFEKTLTSTYRSGSGGIGSN